MRGGWKVEDNIEEKENQAISERSAKEVAEYNRQIASEKNKILRIKEI